MLLAECGIDWREAKEGPLLSRILLMCQVRIWEKWQKMCNRDKQGDTEEMVLSGIIRVDGVREICNLRL